jgi:hypothetical protein
LPIRGLGTAAPGTLEEMLRRRAKYVNEAVKECQKRSADQRALKSEYSPYPTYLHTSNESGHKLNRRVECVRDSIDKWMWSICCDGLLSVVYDREEEAVRKCVGVVFDKVAEIDWEGVDGVDGYLWRG